MPAAYVVAPRRYEIRVVPTLRSAAGEEMKEANPFPRRAGHEPAGTVVEVGRLVKVSRRATCSRPTEPRSSRRTGTERPPAASCSTRSSAQSSIIPKGSVCPPCRLDEIGRKFEDNLGREPGYIKGVVMPFME